MDTTQNESSASQKKKVSVSPYKIRRFLFIVILVFGIFAGGYYAGYQKLNLGLKSGGKVVINREVPQEYEDVDFALFWEVWDKLQDEYLENETISERDMVYGAIQGMVASVGDPYTVFLPPDENKIIQEDLDGNFEGVGIQIGFQGSQLAVIAPLADSPAQEAGVQAGDFIIGITDVEKEIERGTNGISIQEAVQLIRGPAGSVVTLTLLREGVESPFEVEIRRTAIDVPTVSLSFIGPDENIAHIELNRFGMETRDEWEDIVTEVVRKQNVEGIILDMRNNPGGFLDQSQYIASEFLEIGDTAVIEEDSTESRTEYLVERLGRFGSFKTVVLINEGSASASEIVAGALRDEKNIQLIGQTTFGKGTIQKSEEFPNNAGLHITVARWLTPNGTWVNDSGLSPDIEIEENLETIEDEQLQRAIQAIEA